MIATSITEKYNASLGIWEPYSMQIVNVKLTQKQIHARVSGRDRKFCRTTGNEIKVFP